MDILSIEDINIKMKLLKTILIYPNKISENCLMIKDLIELLKKLISYYKI